MRMLSSRSKVSSALVRWRLWPAGGKFGEAIRTPVGLIASRSPVANKPAGPRIMKDAK